MKLINKGKVSLMEKIRKTNALQLYKEESSHQWEKREDLERDQLDKLKNLLEHGYKNVPYFRKVMEERGLSPDAITKLEDLAKFPLLNKELIKEHKEDLHSADMERYSPAEKRTGGSTGEPLRYYLPKVSHSMMWANIWRGWNVAGYTPGDKMAVLAGGSLLSGFDYKRQFYYYLNNWIPFSSYDMSQDKMKEYVEQLKSKNVQYMYAYSSAAYELANYIMENKLDVDLKAVITTSEVLLPRYRQAIEEAFQCKVYDQYGANDGGVTAFECKEQNGLHINMERCIVEIVDEEGNIVPDGEEGRILLTDLSNYAMPFIRYEVGDYGAVTKEPCPCGRGLIRLTHIKGRQQEFIFTSQYGKVHGGFFSTTFRRYDEVDQFQVIQEVAGSVTVRLKINDSSFKVRSEELRKHILEKAQLSEVAIEFTDAFEKTKGGKHKFVINKVSQEQ